ncbi:MAG: energy-coupling factor transporter transmembrane component T family protein [Candidatus Heimdallarchaeota archaeon]
MSFRLLEYFNFDRKKSVLHHIDPRSKLLFVIAMTCLTIVIKFIIPSLFILAFVIPFIFLSNFFKKWLMSLIVIIPIFILIIIFNSYVFTVANPTTLGIITVIRLMILSAVFGIFFQTVSPDDISQMLVKFKFPYSIAWAMSTAYRFLPTLATEAATIMDAQKARGLQIDRGNIFKRIKNFIPLLIPILASSLRRSWQLAEAIESRGWNATKKRTYLYSLKLKWYDILFSLFSLAIFGLFLYLVISQIAFPSWMNWMIPEKYEFSNLMRIAWKWIKGIFS